MTVFIKNWLVGGFVLPALMLVGGSPPATAQSAVVVGVCGTSVLTAGGLRPAQIDTTGALCTNGTIVGTLPAFASVPTFNLGTAPTITTNATLTGALPTGANAIGSITNTAFGITGTLPAFAAPPPVVGVAAPVTVAQTVTAASAYASGNAVGGLITLAAINRASGASIFVQSVTVRSQSLQAGQMDLVLFNANPTASTCTDKTAISVAAADAAKVVGSAHVSDWTALGISSLGQMQQPAIGVAVPATALYACLVTRSTPTFTATTDISVTVFAVQN